MAGTLKVGGKVLATHNSETDEITMSLSNVNSINYSETPSYTIIKNSPRADWTLAGISSLRNFTDGRYITSGTSKQWAVSTESSASQASNYSWITSDNLATAAGNYWRASGGAPATLTDSLEIYFGGYEVTILNLNLYSYPDYNYQFDNFGLQYWKNNTWNMVAGIGDYYEYVPYFRLAKSGDPSTNTNNFSFIGTPEHAMLYKSTNWRIFYGASPNIGTDVVHQNGAGFLSYIQFN
jgi:hypothetical protein